MTGPALEAGARHERRVARRLEARGSPGLAEALCKLRGIELGGRWRIESLYAAGAEGAVYLLSDLRNPAAMRCVAKVPLLPYHRPAEISASSVRKRREALREEASHLETSASPHMPRSQGLHEFRNPLLDPARGGTFQEIDRALVMEWIAGLDVDLWLARVHHSRIPRDLLRHHLDRIAIVLLEALFDLQERGFLYADLRPGNLRMVGGPGRRVRLLDAGSLVLATDHSGKFPHVPHYLPPALFEQRYGRGVDILPTPAAQAVMAGRTLYEVATGIVPIPGQPLRTEAYKDCAVSPLVADIVDGLATGSFENVVYAMRYLQKQSKRAPRVAPAPAAIPAATPKTPAPTVAVTQRPAPAPAAAPAAPATPRTITPAQPVTPRMPVPAMPATPRPAPAPATAPAVRVAAAAAAPAAVATPAVPRTLPPLEFAPDPVTPLPAAPRSPERRAPATAPQRQAPQARASDTQFAARPPSARRLLASSKSAQGGWFGRVLRWALGRS